jgi:hypothetical protein
MLNNRLMVVIAAAVLLVVAAGVVRIAGTEVSITFSGIGLGRAKTAVDLSDYFQRHSGSSIAAAASASDWFERHANALAGANAADISDYFQRHPTALKIADADGAAITFSDTSN